MVGGRSGGMRIREGLMGLSLRDVICWIILEDSRVGFSGSS